MKAGIRAGISFLNGTLMASPRQIAANRRNGAKGGPKTEAGKQQSRLSSLKHGLTSSTLVVLPEEHEHEYNEVLRGFRESFNPADPAEHALVLRLAQTHWRSLRSRRVETAVLHVTAKTMRGRARETVENCPQNLNPHEAIAVGFMALPEEHWRNYFRYDAAIARDFFKTLEALQKLQRTRDTRKQTVGQAVSPNATYIRLAKHKIFLMFYLYERAVRKRIGVVPAMHIQGRGGVSPEAGAGES